MILGLTQFSGIKFPELFGKVDVKKSEENSDSDSDYEYFKVQHKVENEINCKKSVEETDIEDPKPSDSGNTFKEAVKSALVEDELILPATVNQTFLVVPMKLRLVTLCSLIVEHCVLNKKGGKMIVFMATLEMVDYHADLIETVLTGKEDESKESKAKTKKKKRSDSANKVNIIKICLIN